MAVLTPRIAPWMQWITPDRFNDAELFRIVTFFVFHSPCVRQTSMGKTLKEYGWVTPWRSPYYLNRQLRQAATNYELLFSAQGYDEMEIALKKADLMDNFPRNLERERICIYDNEKNQFMSVFNHLRNALAHCRLNMVDVAGECVFIFEDVQPRTTTENLKVSARMILRKSTLIKWIELIEGGEQAYQQKHKAEISN